MRSVLVLFILLLSVLVTSVAKVVKQKRAVGPQRTLKEKEGSKKEVTSKKSKYVDDDEEISCECSCLSMMKEKQEAASKSRGLGKKDKPCTGNKCKSKPKI